ncbi:UNVERIFIED_CONTAM: Mechanosensitive ion channel protein 8 [Sesamum calycinum]|uniref:Mechanosensitive ion channel protein 8 n=1 Tax=Sesamum calycinum TaxID=2727403 RepID=A0AAW2P943_9LAMI
METLRKSFKSSPPKQEEERQILLTEKPPSSAAAAATMASSSSTTSSPSPAKEGVTKINSRDSPNRNVAASNSNDGGANRMWRDSSYDFSNDAVMRAAASSKDFDFVTESPMSHPSPLSRIPESPSTYNYGQLTPRDVRVSFHENVEPAASRRSGEPEEVVVCSSNNSFRRKSSLMRTKTKSRLLDPPEDNIHKSQTQRMVKSQVLGKGTSEIDEDDFSRKDLPEDYKRMKFSFLSILQLLSLILIVAALIVVLTIDFLKKKTVFQLELWKWELMVLVLISGRLVSGWGVRIVVFFIERNFLLRKRVLYFVYGLRNAVQNCVWLALVLIAWQCIFDKKVERVTKGKILPYVTKIWVCLFGEL